jgi:glycosyltransferase involved in cell wall biosynthesis
MSVGCAIVASDTKPLHEAIKHNETGRMVDFFDINALTNEICTLLEDSRLRKKIGENARAFAIAQYDLQASCLPRQLEWVDSLLQPQKK